MIWKTFPVAAAALLTPLLLALPVTAAEKSPAGSWESSLSDVLDIPPPKVMNVPARDPFKPASPRVKAVAVEEREPPLPNLDLSAVITGPGQGAAIVNGNILREGDEYQGLKVIKISATKVLLDMDGREVTLIIKETLYNQPGSDGE